MTPALLPLLREIGDLKRITSAGRAGSIAERAFRTAWAALVAGEAPGAVALRTCARMLAATRLGDLDAACLLMIGLSQREAADVQADALACFAGAVDPGFLGKLQAAVRSAPVHAAPHAEVRAAGEPRSTLHGGPFEAPLPALRDSGAPQDGELGGPPFVDALAAQPRAGATCPGRPRIVLLPAENHAEHCLVVAVYGILLAEPGADLGTIFLASLAHHLHNAAMPDAGFTGEMLLGSHLEPVMRRATDAALAELPPALAREVVAARRILGEAETPEGRAFQAADVIDRVLELDQHVRRTKVTMADILGDMALVHEGPLKPYHDRVLAEMGLG